MVASQHSSTSVVIEKITGIRGLKRDSVPFNNVFNWQFTIVIYGLRNIKNNGMKSDEDKYSSYSSYI